MNKLLTIAASSTEPAERAPRCQHIKANGVRCGSPALRHRTLCYFHERIRTSHRSINTILEDGNAVQFAIMQITRAIINGTLDVKRAGLLLYGLQTAVGNLKRVDFEPYPGKLEKDVFDLEQGLAIDDACR